jgi:hypothetical protein
MCRRVTCPECGKATFAGCGMHVEQVLGGVPQSDRCAGHAAKSETRDGQAKRNRWWPFG